MHPSCLLLLGLLLAWACQSPHAPQDHPPTAAAGLTLSWKVKNQWEGTQARARCTFTLTNRSTAPLKSNWMLYFSQLPRRIVQAGDSNRYQVEPISGDWHRLRPTAGFRLAPGDSVAFSYTMAGTLLKQTDAPLGPYLIYRNERGEESAIGTFPHYQPPTPDWLDQEELQANLSTEWPDATQRFIRNQEVSQLPEEATSPLLPTPRTAQWGEPLALGSHWRVHYDQGLAQEAQMLADQLEQLTGLALSVRRDRGGMGRSTIYLREDPKQTEPEGYRLQLASERIVLQGGSAAGVFYGCQSLLQLISLENLQQRNGEATLPSGKVADAPRFPYRGLHLDVARNFQEKAAVLKVIDLMAHYKLNRLQLYLSEDEGWRLEIEELPELTEVASKRGHTLTEDAHLHPSYGSGPSVDNPHGSGFYTRNEFKEIIRYAHERHVQVIPTFNFPAHARAAIVAMEARYQRLMAEGQPKAAREFRLIDPEDTSRYYSAQGYHDNVVSVARPSTYRFYQTVLDDVAEMYAEAGVPFTFFHTGGDEVPDGAWAGSPQNLALLDSLTGIDDPRNLQVHFFDQAVEMLNERNLMVGGWEEVALEKGTEGLVINDAYADKNVVPYVWNTLGDALDLGYRLANAGYPVVICNVQNLYFDLAYTAAPEEPGLYWGGFVDTHDAWSFAPFALLDELPVRDPRRQRMEALQPEAQSRILGLQGQLWSETIKGQAMLEYYLLPKLLGLAERAWATDDWEALPAGNHRQEAQAQAWARFANGLGQRHLPRLGYLWGGLAYRVPPPGLQRRAGQWHANVAFPGLVLHYTLDGSEPTQESPLYRSPVDSEADIRLKAFDAAGRGSRTVRRSMQDL